MFTYYKECEKKAKARRSYVLPMNEYRMAWWIMNVWMVVLAADVGWLNESDRFTLSWKDCLGHLSMREKCWARLNNKTLEYMLYSKLICKVRQIVYQISRLQLETRSIHISCDDYISRSYEVGFIHVIELRNLSYELRHAWETFRSVQTKEWS